MQAALCRHYGAPELIEVADIDQPRPAAGQILVRIHASTVSSADHRIRALDLPRGMRLLGRPLFGLRRPRQPILGTELSGEVVALGAGVSSFAKGDRIFAFPGLRGGGHAQYTCLPVNSAIARCPANLTMEEAAALSFGGSTALHFLRDKAALRAGESVLVIGAGGAVGSAAVQLSRAFGAHVTGMCSPTKADIVRDLGAERVLPSGPLSDHAGRHWDVIVDTVGVMSMAQARLSLAPGGRLVQVLADLPQMIAGATARLGQGRRVIGGAAGETAAHLADLADLARNGLFRPLIGARFPLSDIVLAHEMVATGHKLGSVVITMV